VSRQAEKKLLEHPHGDLPRWRAAIEALPLSPASASLDQSMPELGAALDDPAKLRVLLMELHPWRKGPLQLGGLSIDTEWRSDLKWDRVAPHIDLAGHKVLDIGCGNGYFGLRMLGAGAELVVGIDPTLIFVMQWLACRHFSGDIPSYVLPLGIEDLPEIPVGFDTVFSMGVLYHRRDPVHHLRRIHDLLKKEGSTMVLETLVLPKGREHEELVPRGRYARMPNVWSIPGTSLLQQWVRSAGFREVNIVDVSPTSTGEQRSTEWMKFESLDKSLDPLDKARTIEGLPAPVRAVIIAGV
jgi:tRNA (mo5U34)-methyltransferase